MNRNNATPADHLCFYIPKAVITLITVAGLLTRFTFAPSRLGKNSGYSMAKAFDETYSIG